MFNLGAPEVLVIAILALVVLGPQRLPDAAKQAGKAMAEIRKMSSGFQKEMKAAFREETAAAKAATPVTEPAADAAPVTKSAARRRQTPLTKAAVPQKTAAKKAAAAPKKAPAKKAPAKKSAPKKST